MIIENAIRLAFAAGCLTAIPTLPTAHAQMGGTAPGSYWTSPGAYGYGPPTGAYGYGPPTGAYGYGPPKAPMAMAPHQALMPRKASMSRRRPPQPPAEPS